MGKFKGLKKMFSKKKASADFEVQEVRETGKSLRKDQDTNLKRFPSGSDSDYASELGATPSRSVSRDVTLNRKCSVDAGSLDTTDSGIRDRLEEKPEVLAQEQEKQPEAVGEQESETKEPEVVQEETKTTQAEEDHLPELPHDSAVHAHQVEHPSPPAPEVVEPVAHASDMQTAADDRYCAPESTASSEAASDSSRRSSGPSFSIGVAAENPGLPSPVATAPAAQNTSVKAVITETPWVLRRQTEYGVVPEEVRCFTCGNTVYSQERVGPIKKVIYHHWCLQCAVCYCQLSMKNFTTSNANLRDRQLYCRTHQPK